VKEACGRSGLKYETLAVFLLKNPARQGRKGNGMYCYRPLKIVRQIATADFPQDCLKLSDQNMVVVLFLRKNR
jgi:hypothetical protein